MKSIRSTFYIDDFELEKFCETKQGLNFKGGSQSESKTDQSTHTTTNTETNIRDIGFTGAQGAKIISELGGTFREMLITHENVAIENVRESAGANAVIAQAVDNIAARKTGTPVSTVTVPRQNNTVLITSIAGVALILAFTMRN